MLRISVSGLAPVAPFNPFKRSCKNFYHPVKLQLFLQVAAFFHALCHQLFLADKTWYNVSQQMNQNRCC